MPLLVLFLCVLLAGCASSGRSGSLLYQDLGVTVWLDAFPDTAFRAAHPISLDPTLVVRVLQGVQVREEQRILQTLMAGPPSPVRVFSDEQATALAPALARALTVATPEFLVRFQVADSRSSASQPTAGRLYAYGRSLYLSLTHAGIGAERATTDTKPGRELPDSSGLKGYKVGFLPQEVLRPDVLAEHEGSWGWARSRTVVIDYMSLAGLPASGAPQSPADTSQRDALLLAPAGQTGEQPAATSREVQALRDLVIQKDLEIEALKKELAALRRRMSEQTAPGGKPAPKSGRSTKPKSSR